MEKPRILIKLSGSSLSNNEASNFSPQLIDKLVNQIIELQKKYSIGIVVGGGNFWRGDEKKEFSISLHSSHKLGMIATVFNSFLLQNIFLTKGVKTKVYSPLKFQSVTNDIDTQKMNSDLTDGYILIFACGTGIPYVSTDTTAAIRALEIGAKIIIMAKDGVDGVYSSDPKKDKNAIFYPQISCDAIVEKQLKVIDLTALILCKENKLTIKVFNQQRENALIKIFENKIPFTLINNE